MTDGSREASRIPAPVLEEEQNEFFLCDRTGTSPGIIFSSSRTFRLSVTDADGEQPPGPAEEGRSQCPTKPGLMIFFFKITF